MEKNMSKMTKSKYIIYGLGVSYFMIDQIYNQWLSYYYLPPETEKNLVPLLKPQYLVLAFIFARQFKITFWEKVSIHVNRRIAPWTSYNYVFLSCKEFTNGNTNLSVNCWRTLFYGIHPCCRTV